MTCPHCREDARCKGLRGRAALTLLGALRFERHYYHCRHCGRGSSPLDQALGLTAGDLSPAAEEVVCLAGVQASFAEAASRTLSRLAGLRVSESTAQRATEAAGGRVEKAQAAGQTFGPAQPWAWHKDADGCTVGYLSADATGVGQQGPAPGQGAEGRMAYVGMIYNPVPADRQRWADPHGRRPAWQARYVAQLQPLAALSEPLRRQGGQVGLDQAQRWIALSDGGELPARGGGDLGLLPRGGVFERVGQGLAPRPGGGGASLADVVVPAPQAGGGPGGVGGLAGLGPEGAAPGGTPEV